MQLLYCYIRHFRNIENQEIHFSDKFSAHFDGRQLIINRIVPNQNIDYVYGDHFMQNLRVLVGKTGSGKTNLLQLIGMSQWDRLREENQGAYLLLYKTDKPSEFVIEIAGLTIPIFTNIESHNWHGSVHGVNAYKFAYNFDNRQINNVRELRYEEMEQTYIVNSFDRYSFAHYPHENEHKMEWNAEDGLLPRLTVWYGKSTISMECMYLRDYLQNLPTGNIKRNSSLVINWNNWQNKISLDLDEELLQRDYWTYIGRAEEQKRQNILHRHPDKPIKYPKGSTPKKRFLHDLMTDFAIYLRKCADSVEPDFKYERIWRELTIDLGIHTPYLLPDKMEMNIRNRITWLCQYIDFHTDEIHRNKGLLWQISRDIIDLYDILDKLDDKYFTDEIFSIPVVDIDTANGTPMSDLFERMDQYRADELGIFTEQLLPYHWTYVSSGEYQYAKIWGILETYGVQIKMMAQGVRYEDAVQPNIILLLDEPESFMHPEMCRCFIHKMNEILQRRFKKSDLQIILSTHSPFMLSDVLSNQVIKMDYDELGKCRISQNNDKPYFAANIHSIMADGFFLQYSIGEQARLFLTDKFNILKSMMEHRGQLSQDEKDEVRALQHFSSQIGDDIIRLSFENLIQQLI